ncbi:hypothetical protein LUZ62_024794 [Rhynchospora pubera]|uniref:RING-type domain-containing protein n=1 Tax=Rhynchospora pubera TaxID=906938 RepID=A0AAV8HAI2_9POAL|nr:hypothetical protein LUZ62_024794 [Rhynchospora pubera]
MTNPSPSTSTCTSTGTSSDDEWDEIRCPICMDHPHNAVRLNCSSINCRCFICDTSYRHSNCLDRFKRLSFQNNTVINTEEIMIHLKCPLCRGDVTGWTVNEEARQYMDKKSRDCSRDKCEFNGNYEELRSHARKKHPLNRPAEVEPSRQHQWRRLEQQQELGDVMSAIRSEIPGAVVVGDYAVEANEVSELDNVTAGNADGSGSWLTTLVLGPIMGSPIRSSLEESGEFLAEPTTAHPNRRRRRRYLWGEILLGLQYGDDNSGADPQSHDDGDVYDDDGRDDNTHVPRRRLDNEDSNAAHRSRPEEDYDDAQDTDDDYTDETDEDDDDDEDDADDEMNGDGDAGTDISRRWGAVFKFRSGLRLF